MAHDAKYSLILNAVAHIAGPAQSKGKERRAECHPYFVAQRYKGILESVVTDAGFPFAIFNAIGNYGMNGRIESGEEKLGYGGQDIKRNGTFSWTEKIQGAH